MYISKLIIINYKSCRIVDLDFEKDYPNIMVGINDGGKTSILRALGHLLGDKFTFNFRGTESFRSDISNTPVSETEFGGIFQKYSLPTLDYAANKTFIMAQFSIENGEIDEEKTALSNQLLWCLENTTNNFWLCKEYYEDTGNEGLLILLDDTKEENIELWNLSSTNLDKKIREYEVTKEEIENRNKAGRFKSIEKIRAIYGKTALSKYWKDYVKGFKSDKDVFPKYRYLDWNLNLNDLRDLVSDTMANVVEKYKNEAMVSITGLAEKAENEINAELEKFRDDLFVDIPNIEAIEAKFKLLLTEDLQDILIKKTNSDEFIHVESQGEGVKRRIWFAFIKWNALKSLESVDSYKRFVWCFDEPETHLYPGAQREFFDMIKKLSSANLQTIISTHSTIFTDKSKFETIKNVNLEDKYTIVSTCKTTDDIFNCLQLKNSDFLFYDKFLAVEGDTEEILMPYLYTLYTKTTLGEDGIQLIKLNSKSKKIENQKILEQIIRDFRKPEDCLVFILDNDSHHDDKTVLGKLNVKLIGKQDIEDSIENEVWKELIETELKRNDLISINDLEKMKSEIPNDVKVAKVDKFYKKLQVYLRRKLVELGGEAIDYDLLPDKGKTSAEMIIKYIKNISQVDQKIKEAFDLIRPVKTI